VIVDGLLGRIDYLISMIFLMGLMEREVILWRKGYLYLLIVNKIMMDETRHL
jgi:hypothetical protein